MHHVNCQVLIIPVNQVSNINFKAVNCINQATYLVPVLATALKQSGKNVIFSMFSSRLESKFRAQIQTSRTQRQRIKGRVTLIYETDEVAIISLL